MTAHAPRDTTDNQRQHRHSPFALIFHPLIFIEKLFQFVVRHSHLRERRQRSTLLSILLSLRGVAIRSIAPCFFPFS
jgi:hypothetical protein